MVIGLMALALFGLGLPAFALDGPTPPKLGDPASGDVSPHGGYSSGTDFCLQCHQVHNAPDPGYALMAKASTTAVCATCHGYLGAGPTGAIDPDSGGIIGTTSQRAVYTSTPVHGIGLTGGPNKYASNWNFGWGFTGPQGPSTTNVNTVKGTASAVAGGLYCMNCHTPHGEFGQLINSRWVYTSAGEPDPDGTGPLQPAAKVKAWANGTPIWWDDPDATPEDYVVRYLHQAGTSWEVCTDTTFTSCAPAQVYDAENQLVSLYGYKLLSSSPNHQYPFPTTGSPPGGLYSNAGAMIGDLVGGISATDLTFTVNEMTGTLTAAPGGTSGYVKIGTETIRWTARTAGGTCTGTFPCSAAVYTVAPADPAADGKTGRGWNNTTAAAHAAGDDVLTFGTMRASVRSWDTDIYNHDGSPFCGTCHSSRIDWSWGGTSHSHPTGCEACHGNPGGPAGAGSRDYPHSSTSASLLQEEPDALCINCHTAGSLP